MPTAIIQMGHVARRTGATGTTGEQIFARQAAERCRFWLTQAGWDVEVVFADIPDSEYAGDAFAAIHCDGSTSPSARGASVGYRSTDGQALGQRWKTAYARHGWEGGWRPDNYTSALKDFYGTRKAHARGNTAAIIVEAGFLTNPDNRAALTSAQGPDRLALAIAEAISGKTIDASGAEEEEEDMPTAKEIAAEVWAYPLAQVDAGGTKVGPAGARDFLRHSAAQATTATAFANRAFVTAQRLEGAVKALSSLIAQGANNLTAEDVEAAVDRALKENTEQVVNVTITGIPGVPQ